VTAVSRRTAVTLATFYAAFSVALWPEESYAQMLRFGGVPSFLAALPYALALGSGVAALHLGKVLRSATRAAVVALAGALPFVTLGAIMARTPAAPLAAALGALFATAVVLGAYGATAGSVPVPPTFQSIIVWGGAVAILVVVLRTAPDAVPSELIRAALVYGLIPPAFPWYIVAAFAAGGSVAVWEARREQ